MSIQPRHWGHLKSGQSIKTVEIRNKKGTTVQVSDLGAIITKFEIQDKNGINRDVVLGYDSPQEYLDHNIYAGCMVGRFANRIGGAKFTLDGVTYPLLPNIGESHLHGGELGFDKVVWKFELENSTENKLEMSYFSIDGEEGYPGNLKTTVQYILEEDDTFRMRIFAETDKPTVVNLTNHTYFNLRGDNSSILDHELKIHSNQILECDSDQIVTGDFVPVKDTPFDFSEFKSIGKDLNSSNQQLVYGQGYDHCYVLPQAEKTLLLAGEAKEKTSGLHLQAYTTEPGVQFYIGIHLPSATCKGGFMSKYSGFCLETQHFPDSPNKPTFPSTVLLPGEQFETETVWKWV
ncbi:MAG: aldose epimerase family protein [Leadbetterella sp.]